MNREQRRGYKKNDILDKKNNPLETYCTISECLQIARASAQDIIEQVIREYSKETQPQVIATSLQVDVLRNMLFKSGILDEEEFKAEYAKKATEFNELQKKYKESLEKERSTEEEEPTPVEVEQASPKLSVVANDVEIKKETKDE